MALYYASLVIVYPNQVPYDTDILRSNLYSLVGDSGLAATILGIGINYPTLVRGFPCVPVSPPGLSVVVGSNQTPDAMYGLQPILPETYGSLPVDTTPANQQFKQAFNFGQHTFSTPAPVTSGYSVIHLVEVAFSTQNVNNVSRPYFNSVDPTVPIFNNNYDTVINQATVQLKQGIAAASPTPPTPDAGFIGLYYVTVTFGQTSIISGNITVAPGAPFITESLTQKISQATLDSSYVSTNQLIQSSKTYWPDTSVTANSIVVTPSPAYPTLQPGTQLQFKAANSNTSSTVTITVDSQPPVNAIVAPGIALRPNDILANGNYSVIYDGTNFQVLNPSTNDSVVSSWDGSTTPVAVTAGTDISITGGAISFVNGGGTSGFVTASDLRACTWISGGADTGTTNHVVLNPSPAYPVSTAGASIIIFSVAHPNNGPTDITINGNGPIPIEANGVGLVGGELTLNCQYVGFFQSTSPGNGLILTNPNPWATAANGNYTTGDDTGSAAGIIVASPYANNPVLLKLGSTCTIYPAHSRQLSAGLTLNWAGTGVLNVPNTGGGSGGVIAGIPAVFVIDHTLSFWVLVNPY